MNSFVVETLSIHFQAYAVTNNRGLAMFIGLLMWFLPMIIFLFTLPFLGWLNPKLRNLYRILAGAIVFIGSGISLYFAAYTGDQGGVSAFYFQALVIVIYSVFSIILIILNVLLPQR